MQRRILLALVGTILASPAAFADSANVTIGGNLRVGVDSYKLSQGNATSPNAAGYSNETRVDDQLSYIYFAGSEDLGGGLKAFFRLTTPIQPDLGVLTGTGDSYAGFEGGFGKIYAGRLSVHYIEFVPIEVTRAGSLQNFLSMGPGLQVNGVGSASGFGGNSAYLFIPTRTANIVVWDSPSFGGITARIAYSTAPATNEGSGRNPNPASPTSVGTTGSKGSGEHFAIRYVTADPLMGGISWWKATTEQNVTGQVANSVPPPTLNLNEKSTRAWVGYRFPFGLKVGLGYDKSEVIPGFGPITLNDTLSFQKRTAYLLPLTYTAGAHNFYLTYLINGKTSGQVTPGINTHDDTGARAYMLGWDMALSKRTFFGVFYTKLDNDKNAAYSLFNTGVLSTAAGTSTTSTVPNFGESISQIWIGISHNF